MVKKTVLILLLIFIPQITLAVDGDVVIEGKNADSIDAGYIDLELDAASPGTQEGRLSWNDEFYTQNIDTGLGPVIQVGQEDIVLIYNNTGDTILDGRVIYPTGGQTGGIPEYAYARANYFYTLVGKLAVATHDIADGTTGIATVRGRISNLDTSGLSLGAVYISPTSTAGELTNTRPSFPDYPILMGTVDVVDASAGVISVSQFGDPQSTIVNFWNGVFRESIDFLVTSDGAIITGSLSPQNGHDDMTMIFSSGPSILDTSPPATITLTAGTDSNPQTNYVYIPQSTKVLTVSTSDWPTAEHIKVAQVLLQSAATVQIDGALRNQNWNDHIQSTTNNQGHLSHMAEKLRQFEAQWDSGVEGSITVDGANVTIQTTAGYVYQMHKQVFPLTDMRQYGIDAVSTGAGGTFTISGDGDLSSTFPDARQFTIHNSTNNDGAWTVAGTTWSDPDFIITVESDETVGAVADGTIGDNAHVPNHDVASYTEILDLTDLTNDASGNPLNNTSFALVVWGIQNKTGEAQHIMVNLPTGTYSKNFPQQAVNDANNYSVYTIPGDFQGVGFLIGRYIFVNNGGTWTLDTSEDLRGYMPNVSAGGGGGGGGGVTTFLGLTDTPSAYTGEALNIPRVNAGETGLEFLDITTDWLTQYIKDSEFTTNGGILVGTGAGTFQEETGNTARTSIGLGTGDSPTFTDLVLSAPSSIYSLSHDIFADFVANEHINHTSVTLTAGNGLTGGGDISNNRTIDVGAGTGISVAAGSVSTNDGEINHDSLLNTHQGVDTGDSPSFVSASLGTGELTAGSINRASGTLTVEIAGTAELSISNTETTFGGDLSVYGSSTSDDRYINLGVSTARYWSIQAQGYDELYPGYSLVFNKNISTNTGDFVVAQDQFFKITKVGGVTAPYVYTHDMNGETIRDLQINDSGELGYDSGSRMEWKTAVNYGYDLTELYNLPVFEFEYKTRNDEGEYVGPEGTGIKYYGMSVDVLADILPEKNGIIYKDSKGEPLGINYKNMVPLLLKMIQDQRKEIESLKDLVGKQCLN